MREQLARRRVFDDMSGVHDDDTRGALRGKCEVVRNEDRRHTKLFGEIVDQIQDDRLGGDIETSRRFVGNQNDGFAASAIAIMTR